MLPAGSLNQAINDLPWMTPFWSVFQIAFVVDLKTHAALGELLDRYINVGYREIEDRERRRNVSIVLPP